MSNTEQTAGQWEKRWHPLRREWVVYAAHRNSRPWSFEGHRGEAQAPAYDPKCYLCPGNPRVHGAQNPHYQDVYIFDNDHPVVGAEAPNIPEERRREGIGGLYQRSEARGIARVLCYDPRHNVTLTEVEEDKALKVFRAWQDQTRQMEAHPTVRNILIFENKGQLVGVSNPHPHCQIYAVDFNLVNIGDYLRSCAEYRLAQGRDLFADIIASEQESGQRIIAENKHAIAFLPFFARFAYEVLIFPKAPHQWLSSLSEEALRAMTQVFQEVGRRYDRNFRQRFPYVMALNQAPVDGGHYPDFRMHLHFLPPLRQPGLQKFLAGPELGADTFMADTLPEQKAAELQAIDLSDYQAL